MIWKIDGSLMTDRAAAHDHLQQALELPEWYGRNLDALYDLVRGMEGEILLCRRNDLTANLGPYGLKLLAALEEAAEKSPRLTFKTED